MSEHHIELLKLQIQREQAARDFWRWAIMYVLVGINPLIDLATAYVNRKAIVSVGVKADTAATKAAIVEEKTDAIAKDTASINAINTNYEARRTEAPEDISKAERAEAKVMAQQTEPPK